MYNLRYSSLRSLYWSYAIHYLGALRCEIRMEIAWWGRQSEDPGAQGFHESVHLRVAYRPFRNRRVGDKLPERCLRSSQLLWQRLLRSTRWGFFGIYIVFRPVECFNRIILRALSYMNNLCNELSKTRKTILDKKRIFSQKNKPAHHSQLYLLTRYYLSCDSVS